MDAATWKAAVGPAWVDVDLDAIAGNVCLLRALLPAGCRLLAVVKANAYGHGATEVAHAVVEAGADGLGVSTVAEALALRAAGIRAPVLAFTPPRPVDVRPALRADVALTVGCLDHVRAVAAVSARERQRPVLHIKCDSGMGRYGFDRPALRAAAAELAGLSPVVQWEGVFTHFARGADPRATRAQLARFLDMIRLLEAEGLHCEVRHAAASAAALAVPEARLDMVRIGTLVYGDRPAGVAVPAGLRRAFALRAEPGQVRALPAGASVGYGSEWTARRPTRVAVLPVGYADGVEVAPAGPYRRPAVLLRALARAVLSALGLARWLGLGAAAGDVEWGGCRAPILGRVGMQQVAVDCSAVPAAVMAGPATLHVRATAVGAHLSRVYLRDGVPLRAVTAVGVLAAPDRVRAGRES